MEEKYISAQDFMDVLELRSDLVYCTADELKEAFIEDDAYIGFIKILYQLIDIDNGGFAILDEEITNTISTLINYKRFDIREKDPETYNLINEIIIKLNDLNALTEDAKQEFINNYVINQEENRNLEFTYTYEILDSMGVDSFIIDYLEGEDLPEDIPDYYLIGSIVYLNNSMPGLFEIEEVQEKIESLLNSMTYSYYDNKLPNVVYKIKEKVLSR